MRSPSKKAESRIEKDVRERNAEVLEEDNLIPGANARAAHMTGNKVGVSNSGSDASSNNMQRMPRRGRQK